jgi:hypothetical protein
MPLMIRRRLQNTGALQFQKDLWLLPHTLEQEKFLTKIIADIERRQGTGYFFISQAGDATQQQHLISSFQAERQQEYREFIIYGQNFLQALAQDILTQQWTFAQLEAHERTLHQLTTRLRGIQRRDFFPDANAHTAQDVFDQCDQTVYEFAITVYTYYETPSQAISTMPR